MRLLAAILSISALAAQDFSGDWNFDAAASEIRGLPAPPDATLKIEQSAKEMTIATPDGPVVYPLDGTERKNATHNTRAKWEGAALLVSTIVSGPRNYTIMERWRRSRDGNTLTIRRTIVTLGGESESSLVYRLANPAPFPASEVTAAPPQAHEPEFVVPRGERILLRLTRAVSTKAAAPGDRIYLETAIPIFVNGRLVIPKGSHVHGTVVDSREAGRVLGRSSLRLRFDVLILPNGVMRNLRSLPGAVDGRGDLESAEGRIEGEGNKAGDARTVGRTTSAGAGIGGIAGGAKGAGIGAAAGAAAGLAGVLGSRGPNVDLPQGTTMELILDRDLRFQESEL
jgi:type IV secretion system protein VirB10